MCDANSQASPRVIRPVCRRGSIGCAWSAYAVVRLHGNLFQPSFKLQEKTRIGARVIKRYHPPVPPVDASLRIRMWPRSTRSG
ncbi:hypothetical protein AJ87_10480 [Rhizobium yanglingense]|nr:hypothetical protein AJ87_10480 [Rhizobium yanglingense]